VRLGCVAHSRRKSGEGMRSQKGAKRVIRLMTWQGRSDHIDVMATTVQVDRLTQARLSVLIGLEPQITPRLKLDYFLPFARNPARKFVAPLESPRALLGQADLLAKGLHARVTTKQGEFGRVESLADPCCTEPSHAIQGLERTVFISQTGIDECL
jgi:hypothetical protein